MTNLEISFSGGEMGDFVRRLLGGGGSQGNGETMAENKREGIRAQLRDLIMGQLQERGHTEDTELLEYIDQAVFHMGQQVYLPLKERLWLRNSLYDSFRRLDILQELLDDKSVTEIMINGAGKIFIETVGKCAAVGEAV